MHFALGSKMVGVGPGRSLCATLNADTNKLHVNHLKAPELSSITARHKPVRTGSHTDLIPKAEHPRANGRGAAESHDSLTV